MFCSTWDNNFFSSDTYKLRRVLNFPSSKCNLHIILGAKIECEYTNHQIKRTINRFLNEAFYFNNTFNDIFVNNIFREIYTSDCIVQYQTNIAYF